MKLTYHHYLFSCLMDNIDDEWAKKEYDLRFEELPKRYGWFEQSKFNDEDKPEYGCILDYLHSRENLRSLVAEHDFTYDYSDDHRKYQNGLRQSKLISEVKQNFTRDDFISIWNTYAPDICKIKS